MKTMTWFCLTNILSAHALPHHLTSNLQHLSAFEARNGDRTSTAGEPPSDRTIFTAISMFCMMILSLLLGSRFSRLRKNAIMKRNITSMLVLVLYFLVMSFIISSAVMLAGQGLYTYGLCFGATWICLILYSFGKLIIYVFLVERVHVVRAPFVRRSRDWLYIASMAVVIVSFGAVAINAYLSPIIEMRESDGRCHMGIPGKASIPFMSVDIAVDVALTGIFFYLLRPVVKVHGLSTISGVFGANRSRSAPVSEKERNATAVQRNIRILLWKSLIGSMLIMIPTVANMVQFYITQGRELALICLAVCVADVSWDAVIIHWLTFGSVEAEKNLTRSTQASQCAELTRQSSSTISAKNLGRDTEAVTELLIEEPPNVFTPRTGEFSDNNAPLDISSRAKPV